MSWDKITLSYLISDSCMDTNSRITLSLKHLYRICWNWPNPIKNICWLWLICTFTLATTVGDYRFTPVPKWCEIFIHEPELNTKKKHATETGTWHEGWQRGHSSCQGDHTGLSNWCGGEGKSLCQTNAIHLTAKHCGGGRTFTRWKSYRNWSSSWAQRMAQRSQNDMWVNISIYFNFWLKNAVFQW